MSEEEYDDYLRFLNSVEDEDEERKKLEGLGLTDSEPLDITNFDPE